MTNPYIEFLKQEARWNRWFAKNYFHPLLSAMADRVDRMWDEAIGKANHPDVKPWFHEDAEPGPYTEDPDDGYPYDE